MAEGTKLVLVFETDEGKDTTISFKYAKPNAETSNVKALINAIITNNTLYENVPSKIKSAKTVTTTEQVYDLTDSTNSVGPLSIGTAYRKGLVSATDFLDYMDAHPDELEELATEENTTEEILCQEATIKAKLEEVKTTTTTKTIA